MRFAGRGTCWTLLSASFAPDPELGQARKHQRLLLKIFSPITVQEAQPIERHRLRGWGMGTTSELPWPGLEEPGCNFRRGFV